MISNRLVGVLVLIFSQYVSLVSCSSLMRQPSRSECYRYAEANACQLHPSFMQIHCDDRFSTCIDYDRKVRDAWSTSAAETDTSGKANQQPAVAKSFYDLEAKHVLGSKVKFERFRGKIVLITNVASECGYTESHYTGLIDLWEELRRTDRFQILAFPCNQFGQQEPGTPQELKSFADFHGVEFLMMQKIDVNGPMTHPVYKFLKAQDGPQEIEWNFNTYYIVDAEGTVRSFSGIDPDNVRNILLETFFPEFLENSGDEEEVVEEEEEME